MTAFRIQRDGELDLSFEGELLVDVSSRDTPDLRRWTEIRIYRTASGKYVTEMIGRSEVRGERDRVVVRVHQRPEDVPDGLRRQAPRGASPAAAPKNYLTKLALDALDEAAQKDPTLQDIVVEEI